MKLIKYIFPVTAGFIFSLGEVCAQQLFQAVPFSQQSTVNPQNTIHFKDGAERTPPCTPGPNDNYANAITLSIGAAAINGTTCNGTLQATEALGCNPNATQTVWYKVTATAAGTYVIITTTGSCYVGASVWPATGLPTSNCTMIDCQAAANGPITTVFRIAGAIGTTYAIQIAYSSGGPCGNEGTFTIRADNVYAGTISNPGAVNSCASPTGGCYFPFTPTQTQVTTSCAGYPLTTQTNLVNKQYFSFTTAPVNSNVLSFQNILQSTCGPGNVQWFFWKLFNTSCNMLSCGDLGNLQNNVACNTTYILQYIWEELPCTYTTQWPYQYAPTGTVGCGTLPVELLSFSAVAQTSDAVALQWVTASENNNSFFTVERSSDSKTFEPVEKINGAGNSAQTLYYSVLDNNPLPGISYYRLRQTDFDGSSELSDIIAVNISDETIINVVPNPASDFINIIFSESAQQGNNIIELIDAKGAVVASQIKSLSHGDNFLKLELTNFNKGIYAVKITSASGATTVRRFVIN
jgi:hypothetical protein